MASKISYFVLLAYIFVNTPSVGAGEHSLGWLNVFDKNNVDFTFSSLEHYSPLLKFVYVIINARKKEKRME